MESHVFVPGGIIITFSKNFRTTILTTIFGILRCNPASGSLCIRTEK